ncbi:MAG: hypothetical protein KIS62_10865 [Ramlibacter sp.]|nr:hypothetical protein [Ramlibacter sp.]
MLRVKSLGLFAIALLGLSLAGCGGGGASIGGTLSGLGQNLSVTLQNNKADSLTLKTNGTFTFPIYLSNNAGYNVTVLTQPTGQSCAVTNGSGTVNSVGTSVTDVAVTCVTTSSVGGTLSGLATGATVVLSNGTVLLPLTANGTFAFPGTQASGTAYSVVVSTQPSGQACTVTNGSGLAVTGVMAQVTVTCV